MSQYNTRINIRVTEEEKWELLSDLDFETYGLGLDVEDLRGDNEFIIDGEWSLTEYELDEFIENIVERIEDVTIISDTTNINVDPYLYYVCVVDGEIHSRMISYEDEDFIEQFDLNITDIDEYLKDIGICRD